MEREVGRHEAQIEILQLEVQSLHRDVQDIKVMLAEAKGSWRTMLALAGVAGLLGAGTTKVLSVFGHP